MSKNSINDSKKHAEHCINILHNVELSLIDSFKEYESLEKQKSCLNKIDIFKQSSDILKEVFKIEK